MLQLYAILRPLHNINRWLLIAALVALTIYGITGVMNKRDFGKNGRTLMLISTILIDVQALFGLLLWISSPVVQSFMSGARTGDARVFAMEHPPLGLIVVALIHVGSVLVKRDDTSLGKNRKAAIWGGVTLLIGIITGIVLTGFDRLLPW